MLEFFTRPLEARRARKAAAAEERVKLDEARQMGAQFGRDLADQMRTHLDPRLLQVRGAYLNVLRQRLATIYDESMLEDPAFAGPSDAARIELRSFLKQLKLLPDQLIDEMRITMGDWMRAADAVGAVEGIEALMRERIGEATLEMIMDGMQETGAAIGQAIAKGYPHTGTAFKDAPDENREA